MDSGAAGATALDKKARKAFEAKKLQQIGAKLDKRPRIAAVIGRGVVRQPIGPRSIAGGSGPNCMCRPTQAKKQRERSTKALEEAINSGLVQRKGMGKKKRRMQAASAGAWQRIGRMRQWSEAFLLSGIQATFSDG